MADCRSELLVAESTRWPALVLQPTRQMSPTTFGESIPDRTISTRYTIPPFKMLKLYRDSKNEDLVTIN
ncbi:unnamed protein product, partial [Staurois parvus]